MLAEVVPTIENGLWRLLPDGQMELTWKIKPSVRSDLLSLIHAVYESGRPAKELSDAALKVCRVNQENRKN